MLSETVNNCNCRDAKVSVLDWDAHNYTMRTTSLHSFEGDVFISASLPASPFGPRLLSDPQVRQSLLDLKFCMHGSTQL